MMHFGDQSVVFVLISLLIGWGESDHPQLFGILPHFRQWCVSLISPSYLMVIALPVSCSVVVELPQTPVDDLRSVRDARGKQTN